MFSTCEPWKKVLTGSSSKVWAFATATLSVTHAAVSSNARCKQKMYFMNLSIFEDCKNVVEQNASGYPPYIDTEIGGHGPGCRSEAMGIDDDAPGSGIDKPLHDGDEGSTRLCRYRNGIQLFVTVRVVETQYNIALGSR